MTLETVRPALHTTRPPSATTECAYADLLGTIRARATSCDSLAVCARLALEGADPSCASELAERLYNAVLHG